MQRHTLNKFPFWNCIASRRTLLGAIAALYLTACTFQQHMQRGDALSAQKQYAGAIAEYDAAINDPYTGGKDEAHAKRDRAQAEWVQNIRAQQAAQAQAGHAGYALLLSAQTLALTSDTATLADCRTLSSTLATRTAIHVRLAPRLDLAPRVIDSLVASSSGSTATLHVEAISEAAATQANDYIVVASQPTVSRERRASTKTVRYITGHTMIPNPALVPLRDREVLLQKDLAAAQQLVGSTSNDVLMGDAAVTRGFNNAQAGRYYAIQRSEQAKAQVTQIQQNLKILHDQITGTAVEVDQPTFDLLTFPTALWTAQAIATLKIQHAGAAGEVFLDEPVRVEYGGDTYAAQPKAKVLAKVSPVITDADLTADMARVTAERVADYFNRSRQAELKARVDAWPEGLQSLLTPEALDAAIGDWWLSNPQSPQPNAALDAAIQQTMGIEHGTALMAALRRAADPKH